MREKLLRDHARGLLLSWIMFIHVEIVLKFLLSGPRTTITEIVALDDPLLCNQRFVVHDVVNHSASAPQSRID